MAEIRVTDSDVTALIIGGEWVNVRDVSVDWAVFIRTAPGGDTETYGTGLYVAATVQGGPHNGDRIVSPLRAVSAIRLDPS